MGLLSGTEDVGSLLMQPGGTGLLGRLRGFLDQLQNPPQGVVPKGVDASTAFHAVANPDAVLNSPVSQVGSGFAPIGMAGVMTYHGTPHKFDSYDLSKIGTGEGAQVYGHGMYFAENPQTANAYRTALAGTEVTTPTGQVLKTKGKTEYTPEHEAMKWVDMQMGGGSEFPIHTALLGAIQSKESPEVINVLRKWNSGGAQAKQGGAMLKQDLPDEMLPKMLQWDKPLSEQPAAVKAALKDYRLPDYITGEQIYDMLKNRAMSAMEPSQRQALGKYGADAAFTLQTSGIPGMSYLDAGSRGAGKGTMNHVVWDQELLNRMKPQVVE